MTTSATTTSRGDSLGILLVPLLLAILLLSIHARQDGTERQAAAQTWASDTTAWTQWDTPTLNNIRQK